MIPFVPDDIRATEGALCYRLGQPELWFNNSHNYDNRDAREAIKACGQCEVRTECLDIAMRAEVGDRGEPLSGYSRYGIWAGLTPIQRAKLAGGSDAA